MGTTVTVIYPTDPCFVPGDSQVDRLIVASNGDLASLLGFPPNRLVTPQVEIIRKETLFFGEGAYEPVIRSFGLPILNAYRLDPEILKYPEPLFFSTVPDTAMALLENIFEARFSQMSYKC